jgi:hypothetical protein
MKLETELDSDAGRCMNNSLQFRRRECLFGGRRSLKRCLNFGSERLGGDSHSVKWNYTIYVNDRG